MFLSHEELITQLCQHFLFLQTTAQKTMFKILFQLGLQLGQMGQETKVADITATLYLNRHKHMNCFCRICSIQQST